MNIHHNPPKVFVGMSGGVDSSLSAALLIEQGYDVTGVFIKVWQPDFIECTWKEDRLDAMRVAAQLGIPFVTLDFEKEYKQGVVDYMIEEYRVGRTPNPDVMCNREVKFGAFWNWAKKEGADYIATGHYAIIQTTEHRAQSTEHRTQSTEYRVQNTEYRVQSTEHRTQGTEHRAQSTEGLPTKYGLMKSRDENKDQTYFLWMLTESDLKHVLFPIGNMTKDEVRKEAEKRGLYTSRKKDSQGLCFVGSIDLKTLLKEYIPEKPGDVIDEEGKVIGKHDGAMFYTIGERHGFTITKKNTDHKPLYVISKDIQDNTLTVSNSKPSTIQAEALVLEKTSFVSDIPEEIECYARGRYRAPLARVRLKKVGEEWTVRLLEGELVHTSGQSLVLYDANVCLGGGIMK